MIEFLIKLIIAGINLVIIEVIVIKLVKSEEYLKRVFKGIHIVALGLITIINFLWALKLISFNEIYILIFLNLIIIIQSINIIDK